jgi:hypothetical protein
VRERVCRTVELDIVYQPRWESRRKGRVQLEAALYAAHRVVDLGANVVELQLGNAEARDHIEQ